MTSVRSSSTWTRADVGTQGGDPCAQEAGLQHLRGSLSISVLVLVNVPAFSLSLSLSCEALSPGRVATPCCRGVV